VRLVAGEFVIGPRLAGHRMIGMEERGHIARLLHGLATAKDGRIKPIGYLPSDRLVVYEWRQGRRGYLPMRRATRVTLDDDPARIEAAWERGLEAMARLNALTLGYPFMGLGANSNSVFVTLLAAMGYPPPPVPNGGFLVPGLRRQLL
jgi:hypothetical protein